jgi:hypothetical protein
MEWLVLVIIAGVVWVAFLTIRAIFRALFANSAVPTKDEKVVPGVQDGGMNEGDYHSGPEGYSPMTAYSESQYGSGFDDEAEWNEEH